jgi:hypothetical protein
VNKRIFFIAVIFENVESDGKSNGTNSPGQPLNHPYSLVQIKKGVLAYVV